MERAGQEVPALLHRPKISPDQIPYWDAFQDLTGSRQWTQAGPTSIPYSSILLWLDENLVHDVDERADYIKVIQQVDAGYLTIQYAKKTK
jgi:hypothetical protein